MASKSKAKDKQLEPITHFSESDLAKIESMDIKIANAEMAHELQKNKAAQFDHALQVMHLKMKIEDLKKKLHASEVTSAETKIEDAKQDRRNLLKEYAEQYNIKGERWGYDPITGEIITE